VREADMALYQAKKEEGSSYHFFHRGMDEQLRQRIELEREIGPAIEAGQIIPYYQPLADQLPAWQGELTPAWRRVSAEGSLVRVGPQSFAFGNPTTVSSLRAT